MTNNHLLLIPGLALIALASATQAHSAGQPALDETERLQSTVLYGDLDLGTSIGRAVLKRRIDIAARTVCPIGRFDSAGTEIFDPACVRAAQANVDRQMTTAIAARSAAPIPVMASPPVAGR